MREACQVAREVLNTARDFVKVFYSHWCHIWAVILYNSIHFD
jgi:hypothetical protein